jgi:protoheme IX farnesyltransferase
MLPVIKGQRKTKQQILTYSLLLFLVSLSPYYFGFSGIIYLLFSLILGIYFVYLAYKILKSSDKNKTIYAPKLFKFSILYLYLIFLILVIDKYV